MPNAVLQLVSTGDFEHGGGDEGGVDFPFQCPDCGNVLLIVFALDHVQCPLCDTVMDLTIEPEIEE